MEFKNKTSYKILYAIAGAVAIFLLANAAAVFLKANNNWNLEITPAAVSPSSDPNYSPIATPAVLKEKISILFAGDLMFDRNIRTFAKNSGNDFIFQKISDFLAADDLAVANLEGPITDSKSVSVGSRMGNGNNFTFTFDSSFAKTLFEKNIRVVNLGNNHILNFGSKGLTATKKYLDEAGVEYFGDPGGQKGLIKEIDDLKVGFVNYNQFSGNSAEDAAAAMKEIKKIRAESDIVVLYAHWGIEYAPIPNAAVKKLAREFIDAGADLVIGGHPHVIQPMEIYNGKRIYYSLGNFVFDQYFKEEVRRGLAVTVRIDKKTKQMEFSEQKTYLENNGQTILQNQDISD